MKITLRTKEEPDQNKLILEMSVKRYARELVHVVTRLAGLVIGINRIEPLALEVDIDKKTLTIQWRIAPYRKAR